ncbi:MAG: transglycosylase domain-containing protein [Candidatus Coatesbacteria bacterium]|nr:transglycosylase domain-containing protein [Candidatus Coatesbacteria bacterium]
MFRKDFIDDIRTYISNNRKKLTRIAFVMLIPVSFIIISCLVMEPLINHYTEKITAEKVLPALEKRFDMKIRYSKIENYFLDNQVVIDSLKVIMEEDSILEIGSVELDYSINPFADKKFKITRITMIEPSLYLARNEKGEWNISSLFRRMRKIREQKSSIVGKESLLSALKLPEINIEQGQVVYNDYIYKIMQRVSNLNGSFSYKTDTSSLDLILNGMWPGKKEPFKSSIHVTPDTICMIAKSPPLPIFAFAQYLPKHIYLKQTTSLGGDFTFNYLPNSKDILFKGRLDFVDWGFYHKYVALDTLENITFSINTESRYFPKQDSLDFNNTDLIFGSFRSRIKGSLSNPRTSPIVKMKVYIHHQKIQDLIDGLPASLIPKLKGFKVNGELDYAVNVNWNPLDIDQIEFSPSGNVKDFKIISEPPHTSILKLRDSFQHEVYANGEYIKTILVSPKSKKFVSINDLPDYLVRAVLICEDGGFFGHKGFSLRHIQRAIKHDAKVGRFARGASTISMQLAKNLYLDREKTFKRKFQEALLTFAIENEIPKRRMLEIYFNIIEFGPNIYGIKDATYTYFGRPPWYISVTEAAWLATIIRSPSTYYREFLRGEMGPNHEEFVSRIEEMIYGGNGEISDESDFSDFEFADPPRKFRHMRKSEEEEDEENEEEEDVSGKDDNKKKDQKKDLKEKRKDADRKKDEKNKTNKKDQLKK